VAESISRRDALRLGGGTAVTLGLSVLETPLASQSVAAQSMPVRSVSDDYKEDLFYREDWLGEPWRNPEPVVLIHGNEESSVQWYAWVPQMAQEYRLFRPDLPGLGHSRVPPGFEYSLATLATFVTRVMDKAGVNSAHIVGAKTGAAVAMRFAADYPQRTRKLVVVGGPASPLRFENQSPVPQLDRLGSHASKDMIEYWNQIFKNANPEGVKGLNTSLRNFDFAKEGVLQRITAPTLVITADRTKMQSVEKVLAYQRLIPNSRLAVIRSDAYHLAAANPEECVALTLAFLKEKNT
jgi:3-oxoadipate enol-lactonase